MVHVQSVAKQLAEHGREKCLRRQQICYRTDQNIPIIDSTTMRFIYASTRCFILAFLLFFQFRLIFSLFVHIDFS